MKLRLLDIVLTLISRILIVGFVIVFSPFFFATAFIPKEKLYESKLFFFLGDIMYRVMYRLLFLPTTVKGSSNVPDGQVIFVANHQSSLDIPLLGMLAKQRPHAWLAMAELSKSIVLRWIVRATISVDMSSPIKGMRSLIAAIKVIKDDKMSVMIFPEGRRYVDGKVHDFFAGFAI
jgi:1-acyl-sn-glycerol-3-phosphate acyltransferase